MYNKNLLIMVASLINFLAVQAYSQTTPSVVKEEILNKKTRKIGIYHLLQLEQKDKEYIIEDLLTQKPPLSDHARYLLLSQISGGKVQLTTRTLQLLFLGIDDPATKFMSVQSLMHIGDPYFKSIVQRKVIERLHDKSDETSITMQLLYVLTETNATSSGSISVAQDYFNNAKNDIYVRGAAAAVLFRCGNASVLLSELQQTDDEGIVLGLKMVSQAIMISSEDINPTIEERERIKIFVLENFFNSNPAVRKAAVLAIYGLSEDAGPNHGIMTLPAYYSRKLNLYEFYLLKLKELKQTESNAEVLNTIRDVSDYLQKRASSAAAHVSLM